MSTVFFNDAVKVDINKGEESTSVSIGADIRNVLLVTNNPKFSDTYRKYQNKNQLLLDGFLKTDFVYRFAEIYFGMAVDPYDKPSLLVSGGQLVPTSSDYITKIRKVNGKTDNFGIIITDIMQRRDELLSLNEEFEFILDLAGFIETTEKFYAVHFDKEYIPDMLTWITTNQDEVVLTEKPYGLMTSHSL